MDAPTDANVEGGLSPEAAHGDTDMAKLIPSSLPLETRCQPFPLRQLGGFWLPEFILPGVAAAHARFEPRPGDVFLASFSKSGTTWLKALAFATLHRARHPPSDPRHPLRLGSPHDCVSFFELPFALAAGAEGGGGGGPPEVDADVFAALPSPRVLATHLPYHLLPERVTAESSGCRVVYVSREPKDALVSGWLFTKKNMAADAAAAKEGDGGAVEPPRRRTRSRRRSSCSAPAGASAARSGCTCSGTRRCSGTPRSWAARSPARRRRRAWWTRSWSSAAWKA